jgi:hypothetical protein
MTVHSVEMSAGLLRPVCGATRAAGEWSTQDGIVTCPVCRAFVLEAVPVGAYCLVALGSPGEPLGRARRPTWS